MSEPHSNPPPHEPLKDGGQKAPPAPQPSEDGLPGEEDADDQGMLGEG